MALSKPPKLSMETHEEEQNKRFLHSELLVQLQYAFDPTNVNFLRTAAQNYLVNEHVPDTFDEIMKRLEVRGVIGVGDYEALKIIFEIARLKNLKAVVEETEFKMALDMSLAEQTKGSRGSDGQVRDAAASTGGKKVANVPQDADDMHAVDVSTVEKRRPDLLHADVECGRCHGEIYGVRFKCVKCQNYDLCAKCELSGVHSNHLKWTLKSPLHSSEFLAGELSGLLHTLVVCDGCRGAIIGPRFKCSICPNYDLCSSCQNDRIHSVHAMKKIESPSNSSKMLRKESNIPAKRGNTAKKKKKEPSISDVLFGVFTEAMTEGIRSVDFDHACYGHVYCKKCSKVCCVCCGAEQVLRCNTCGFWRNGYVCTLCGCHCRNHVGVQCEEGEFCNGGEQGGGPIPRGKTN